MPNETDTNAATPSEDTAVGSAPAAVEAATPEVAATPAETVAEVTPPVTEPETSDAPEETTPHVEDGGSAQGFAVQATV
jgi:hypothetical protein